jgi:1-deoxy-D-xylulose-5-phosphate synthase
VSRTLREGTDATIIAYGSTAWQSVEAAKLLENEGLSVGVVDARFCKPLDGAMLARVFARGLPIITVEDHAVINGFGTAVVEHAAEHRYDARLVTRLGLPDRFIRAASRGEQLKEVGLDAVGISRSVRAAMEEARVIPEEAPVARAVPQLR